MSEAIIFVMANREMVSSLQTLDVGNDLLDRRMQNERCGTNFSNSSCSSSDYFWMEVLRRHLPSKNGVRGGSCRSSR
ncbi:hypothetical protein [Pediococcus acidilactici]|uniref:hypothetical protein n=1 Tax=Pediococcus acidilactici TaxID=1254 RepID=UPI001F1A47E2|nr:hypothetical protein [Pediococcus acidilactici]